MKAIGEEYKEQIIEYALSLPGGSSDCPFEEDFDTTVLRHKGNGKWFGLLMKTRANRFFPDKEGEIEVLNLKIDPEEGIVYREMFGDIRPAYHMNKRMWISVLLTGEVPFEVICRLILKSYTLTAQRKR